MRKVFAIIASLLFVISTNAHRNMENPSVPNINIIGKDIKRTLPITRSKGMS